MAQAGVVVQILVGAGAQALAALLQAGVGLEDLPGSGAQVFAKLLQDGQGTSLSANFTSDNLTLNHSGASDIGGAIGVALTDDTLNNVWDNVSSDEAQTGDTEYRCVYVKNTHASLSVLNVEVKIETDPTESNFEIALGAAGLNGTETEVADESTAPATPTFGTSDIIIGTLAAGDNYPIWIKRIVISGALAATPDTGVLHVCGDDPN